MTARLHRDDHVLREARVVAQRAPARLAAGVALVVRRHHEALHVPVGVLPGPKIVFFRLSALRAHAKAPYKINLLWRTLRALKGSARARTARPKTTKFTAQHATARSQNAQKGPRSGRAAMEKRLHRKPIYYGERHRHFAVLGGARWSVQKMMQKSESVHTRFLDCSGPSHRRQRNFHAPLYILLVILRTKQTGRREMVLRRVPMATFQVVVGHDRSRGVVGRAAELHFLDVEVEDFLGCLLDLDSLRRRCLGHLGGLSIHATS